MTMDLNMIKLMRDIMKIIFASDDFDVAYRSKQTIGYVHSVFMNVINIKIDDKLLSIVNSTVNMGPATARLDLKIDFLESGITQDMRFIKKNNLLVFENQLLILEYESVQIWKSSPEFEFIKGNKEDLQFKVEELEQFLFDKGDRKSISPVILALKNDFDFLRGIKEYSNGFEQPFMEYILEPIKDLLKALERDLWNDVDELTKSCIGFGSGLTPSSDDLILGLMTALLYSDDNPDRMIEKLHHFVNLIEHKTTDISYVALIHASKGRVNESIRDMMISILSDQDCDQMIEKAEELIKIGQTSGTDILSGILIGLRLNQYKGVIGID